MKIKSSSKLKGMGKGFGRRCISMVLVLSMVMTLVPLNVFAADAQASAPSPFADVNKSDWFYEAVLYAKENGIFNGTGADTFSPDGSMTRAVYVAVLARLAGIDMSAYKTASFGDVAPGAWYAPYAQWAAERGITMGTGNGNFSPNAIITREQMATLTVRYFKSYNISLDSVDHITTQPRDLASVSPWARESVLLLWQIGLFKGDEGGNFNPVSQATRAEAAVFSMNTQQTLHEVTGNTAINIIPVNPNPTTDADSDGYSNTTKYTINFSTNGGDPLSNWKLEEGTRLNNLPIPYKLDSIFTGWYKDSNLTLPIDENETLNGNLTLYADYSAVDVVNATEIVPYISKMDQLQTFTIGIVTSENMAAADVKAAIIFSSLTNPEFAGIEVTGANKNFTAAAIGGQFEAGGAYKMLLNDNRLSFAGEDSSSRIFDFSIAKPEVLNLGLAGDMKYIAANEVTGMTLNGAAVNSLSVPVARASTDGTELSMVDLSEGTFTYNGGALVVGDNVAIYNGISPKLRDLNTSEAQSGDVAYVTITAVNGHVYTYQNADSKDVLFTPDLLPVSETADTDGQVNNHAITVLRQSMTYTDAAFSEMGLGAETTIDKGDFIAFYSGDFSNDPAFLSYGKIIAVTANSDTYEITYVDATEADMKASMELSSESSIDGAQLLEDIDIEQLERQIEAQAIESGFVSESAETLAGLALKTDSFKALDETYQLQGLSLSDAQLKALSAGDLVKLEGDTVELKNVEVDAFIGTNLKHFENLSGVRCVLDVSFDIVIHTDVADIVIHVTGKFEEEVRIKIKASGGAVWKYKGIFPYIKDYRIHASIDAYNYTGVQIDATIGTFKKTKPGEDAADWTDKSKYEDIAKQLKALMDQTNEGVDTVSDTLVGKYTKMIETKSKWVDLIDKTLFDNEYFADPYHILVYGVKVNFVVAANLNASIGCQFTYENAKRYIFSLGIYSGTSSSDTVSLVEGKYKFTAYVMGTLGLKAGIKIELATGLFSLKLGSIGIIAEVGAYLKLWGYFYYELDYMESQGKSSKSSGALFIEIGIYLKISFKAQVLKGKFKYNPTLYENEWPLLFFGSQKNVNDFSYSVDSTPKVSMAKTVKQFVLPDRVFTMNYMDMKTGEVLKETFDDATNFKIKMSNSDFAYDPALNTITVTPGAKDIVDGKMTITWKGAPLAFTSKPIARTIVLHWENLQDTYSVGFNSKGGSAVPPVVKPYNSDIALPPAPEKLGYVFAGWYLDQNCTQAYTMPAKMPAEDVMVYAKWAPAQNTAYTVEHYQQNIVNNLYTLVESDTLTGTTDALATPARKNYEGFTAPNAKSVAVAADGSTLIQYYYTRNSYTLTFDSNDTSADLVTQVKFGSVISAPELTRQGYTFSAWSPAWPAQGAVTMPANDTTYTAQWTEIPKVAYTVEHYKQNLDSTFTKVNGDTQILSGIPNTTVLATAKSYEGFSLDNSQAGTLAAGKIASNGSLVLKLYYTPNSYILKFDANGGVGGSEEATKYGAVITPPLVSRLGYTFSSWSPNVEATMPATNKSYTAQWTANTNTAYKVEHYLQNLGSDEYTLTETENLTGTTGASVIGLAKDYSGFSYNDGIAGTVASGLVAAQGNLVLKLYYTRNTYTLKFDANGGVGGTEASVKFGAAISAPPVTKANHTFNTWSPLVPATMPAANTTYTAQWTEIPPVAYKVEHYQQNVGNDNFTLFETQNLTGTENATATAIDKAYVGFTLDTAVPGTLTSGTIVPGGTLVLKLYYTRNSYTLKFDANGGVGGSEESLKFGAAIVAPNVTKPAYIFSAWSPVVGATMPASNTTYTAQWTDDPVPLGTGTLEDPYLIATLVNIKWISQNNTAQAGFSNTYFKQTADIDMTETLTVPWVPIGTDTNRFSGTYDGNGYSVEKLYISSNTVRVGLFGVVGLSGSIKDLGVTEADITCTLAPNTTGALTGALVGTLYGLVERCYSSGTVTGDGNTGGLIGYSYGGTIRDSYSTCTVVGNGTSNAAAWDQLGGLLGKMAKVDGRTGSVSTSYASGNINAPNHDQVAGLAGEIDTDQEVYSSFATGVPTGVTNVGGLVGVLQGPMHNSYTTNSSFVGNSGTVTGGQKNVALAWFKTQANFTTAANWHATHQWDFVNTWAIDPTKNNGLPYLIKSKLGR